MILALLSGLAVCKAARISVLDTILETELSTDLGDRGGVIRVDDGSRCLAVMGGNFYMSDIIIYAAKCNGVDDKARQVWKHEGGALKNVESGKCLDVDKASSKNGTNLILYRCNGQENQQFQFNKNSIYHPKSSKCLDVDMRSNSKNVLLWTCKGSQNQKMDWSTDLGDPDNPNFAVAAKYLQELHEAEDDEDKAAAAKYLQEEEQKAIDAKDKAVKAEEETEEHRDSALAAVEDDMSAEEKEGAKQMRVDDAIDAAIEADYAADEAEKHAESAKKEANGFDATEDDKEEAKDAEEAAKSARAAADKAAARLELMINQATTGANDQLELMRLELTRSR